MIVIINTLWGLFFLGCGYNGGDGDYSSDTGADGDGDFDVGGDGDVHHGMWWER